MCGRVKQKRAVKARGGADKIPMYERERVKWHGSGAKPHGKMSLALNLPMEDVKMFISQDIRIYEGSRPFLLVGDFNIDVSTRTLVDAIQDEHVRTHVQLLRLPCSQDDHQGPDSPGGNVLVTFCPRQARTVRTAGMAPGGSLLRPRVRSPTGHCSHALVLQPCFFLPATYASASATEVRAWRGRNVTRTFPPGESGTYGSERQPAFEIGMANAMRAPGQRPQQRAAFSAAAVIGLTRLPKRRPSLPSVEFASGT
ncbi:hypothetical protein HPB51_026668 [Rhipicephalus microplus]|uniref:Uncharacterized protein n=1 Tax=Rhipicephalus microplus TaxID=6941 RepID=A0A9J6D2G0_RHIMP|nr:hypothetical protein HPB51_026668 [Rhipicephalus microplus]